MQMLQALAYTFLHPTSVCNADSTITSTNGFMVNRMRRLPYAIFEYENEFGSTSIDKFFQGQSCYGKIHADSRSQKDRPGCTPCFLVEVRGLTMRVSAMAFIGSAVHCMPLTPYLYLSMLPDARQRKVLVHACAALRQGILELHEHYTSAKGPSQQDAVPYTLFEDQRFSKVTRMEGGRYMYRAVHDNAQVVIKFTQQCGKEVHIAWAEHDWAPQLIQHACLPGGWQQVTMQYLGHEWCQLCDLGEEARNVAHASAVRMLETIQGSSHVRLGGGCGVHGDLRSNNIMVRRAGPSQIRFVDFDWAGMEGVARYPLFMNHRQICWPEGVYDGGLMEKEHDRAVLQTLGGCAATEASSE